MPPSRTAPPPGAPRSVAPSPLRRSLRGATAVRFAVVAVCLVLAGMAAAACEKPDASNTTSPSARALLGTTTGDTAFGAADAPTAAKDPPPGWRYELASALYSKLEDETPALRVTLLLKSEAGATMKAWLTGESGTIATWKGGTTYTSDGTVCWFFRLRSAGESVPLGSGVQQLTIAFLAANGDLITSRTVEVKGQVPQLSGNTPSKDSPVFRDLLGCPRGS